MKKAKRVDNHMPLFVAWREHPRTHSPTLTQKYVQQVYIYISKHTK